MAERTCKDCPPGGRRRPAPYPGPRCATHNRAQRSVARARQHARHIEATYGITTEEYDALYRAQGGRCGWCRRATGARRRLAVDHDHAHCPGRYGCRECVRGLLCADCNRFIGRRLRDAPGLMQRGLDYLTNPPARGVLT